MTCLQANRFWKRQPAPEPPLDCARRDASFSRPVSQAHGSIIDREHARVATVDRLSLPICPTAVGRFVVAVVVLAIQRFPLWSAPHIFKKGAELQPPLTDRDPSATVVLERRALCVPAAAEHRSPYSVFGCLSGLCAFAVSLAAFAGDATLQAATACNQALHQVASGRGVFGPAGALTQPLHRLLGAPGFGDHAQLTERFPLQIKGRAPASAFLARCYAEGATQW